MDELILRYLSGRATDVEVRRVEKWRDASPGNAGRLREMGDLWEALGHVRGAAHGLRPSADLLMQEAERRREASRSRAAWWAVVRSPWAGYGLAAAAVVVAAFVGLDAWRASTGGYDLSPVESSVGEGEVVAMTLSDGTYLRLAPGATLRFPATAGRREVELGGRAFFAVSHAGDPFRVRTGEGDVTVVGTRFQVSVEGEGLEVVVVEGVVEVTARGGTARVLAGQVATVEDGEAPVVTVLPDVWARLDWPGGLLVFQGTPLGAVAEELGRFYGVEVFVEDVSAAGLGITGSFQGGSLDDVVEAVCAVTGIRCETSPGRVLMGVPPR